VSSIVVQDYAEPISLSVPNRPFVLVVDDEEAIVSVVMFLLETEGYAGVGISNSQQVIPFLKQAGAQQMPAVILLDLMMPGLSGYEIAGELAQDKQLASIPVIIMTADNRVRSASAVPGAVDCVNKPFHIRVLLAKLEHYLMTD
jgi:CheY-like chemotaxis protein